LFVTVIGGVASADLTPASRRQDHTTSPSASPRARQPRRPRPPHPAPRPWRSRYAPRVGRDGGGYRSDLGKRGRGIFLQRWLDSPNQQGG